MRSAFLVLVGSMLPVLSAGPPAAVADDGQVYRSDLASLGLGGMQVMSDAEGTSVRGRLITSSSASGTTFFSYRLNDPAGVQEDSFVDMDMQINMNPTAITTSINFPGITVTSPNFFASISAFTILSTGTVSFAP